MAATAYEVHSGSGATVNKDGSVTLTRSFRLNTDDTTSRPTWGIAAINIYKYDAHPDDSTCLATDVTSSPIDGELGWFTVTYTYSNKPFDAGAADNSAGGGDPGQSDPTVQPDPTARTPSVRWGSNFRSAPLERDYNPDQGRQPVANSAKQPFDGFEVESATTVMVLTFNRASSLDIAAKKRSFENTVNDDDFTPVPKYGEYAKGELRCNRWDGTLQYEQGYGWFIACEVEIEYKRDGWVREILDQGYYEHYHNGTQYVNQKIIDVSTGFPVDAPVKLNGSGRKLNPGDAPTPALPFFVVGSGTAEVSVYKKVYPHEYVDWTNLYA